MRTIELGERLIRVQRVTASAASPRPQNSDLKCPTDLEVGPPFRFPWSDTTDECAGLTLDDGKETEPSERPVSD